MTFREAVQSALDVQNACNPSGVIKSLAGPVMDALWEQANKTGSGSRWVGQHPATKLYLYKICEMADMEANSLSPGYEAAERACRTILETYNVIPEQQGKA